MTGIVKPKLVHDETPGGFATAYIKSLEGGFGITVNGGGRKENHALARLIVYAVEAYDPQPKHQVCAEILMIMDTYHEQENRGGIDTPGGLEHMGDVWKKFAEWEKKLRVSAT